MPTNSIAPQLQRLVASINRVIDDGDDAVPTRGKAAMPEIEIERVFELGVVLAARALWEELGIGAAIRTPHEQAKLTAPHEIGSVRHGGQPPRRPRFQAGLRHTLAA